MVDLGTLHPKKKESHTVFISSTFLDNEERRKWVEDAILRAKMVPVGMERFTASTDPIVEECQRQSRECDIYLGIIAHRYGWIPDGHEVSITELEYDAAKQAGRPRLMFEIAPSVKVDPENDFDQGKGRGAKRDKLDEFKVKFRADQMSGLFDEHNLGVMVFQALHDWREKQFGGKFIPETQLESDGLEPELAHYRTVVENQHKDIQLAGFKTRLRVPIALEELYVPLQAVIDLRGTGDALFADAADAEAKLRLQGAAEIPLLDAFREAAARKRRNLVILGDPGSGKTTHLKRLVLACLRLGPDWLGLPDDTLPVFLPLRELADLQQGIDAFIEKTLDSPHLQMPQGFGEQLLKRGRLLLLFDGLDEISDTTQRAKVARWIEGAVEARPDCTAVVTCRFAGYDQVSRLDAGFLELSLRTMTEEQSENFIRNWYKAVETGLTPGPLGENKAIEQAAVLIGRLREQDSHSSRKIAEITHNPLLLANLCLVHRDRGGILPKGRHELYDECIAVLLELWRQNKPIGQGKSLSISIPAETGRRALQPAALWLHLKEERTRASAEELSPILEPALKVAQWRDGDARQFLQTIRDESGLLTGWSHGAYGFMHLGFQEYLAACELRRLAMEEAFGGRRDTLAELASHYGESWWKEVILLLLAQGNPSLFAPFMTEALKQERFAKDSEFLDFILEETAEFSAAPFVELLRQTPPTFNEESVGAGRAKAEAAPPFDRPPPSLPQRGEGNAIELSTKVPSPYGGGLGWGYVNSTALPQEAGSVMEENPVLWANQTAALRVLQRLAPDEITPLLETLSQHPQTEIRDCVRSRKEPSPSASTVFVSGIDVSRSFDSATLQAVPDRLITENGGVELLLIPGERFWMGSPEGEGYEDEHPQHEVEIQPFFLGRYPVTNAEYAQFLQANPKEKQPKYWADRRFNQARQPVVGVDWWQACRFAQWAGGRLPSESEWEYAVRAGTTSRYFWGESDQGMDDYAWHHGNSQGTTHPVGEKQPNAFGLHDMAGNVWEWVQDRWQDNYQGAPNDGSAWECGSGDRRAVRGGSWGGFPLSLRSGYRGRNVGADNILGFRLAREL